MLWRFSRASASVCLSVWLNAVVWHVGVRTCSRDVARLLCSAAAVVDPLRPSRSGRSSAARQHPNRSGLDPLAHSTCDRASFGYEGTASVSI